MVWCNANNSGSYHLPEFWWSLLCLPFCTSGKTKQKKWDANLKTVQNRSSPDSSRPLVTNDYEPSETGGFCFPLDCTVLLLYCICCAVLPENWTQTSFLAQTPQDTGRAACSWIGEDESMKDIFHWLYLGDIFLKKIWFLEN